MDELTEENIKIAVRRVFTVRRRQFGNFPNFPLEPLITSVMSDLFKNVGAHPTQENSGKVREYILTNLDINASLPPE
jgi:hypothetical protein